MSDHALVEAEAAIGHADDAANRDTFHGDRDAYVSRHLLRGLALATVALARSAETIAAVLDDVTSGGCVNVVGLVVTREARP